MPSYRHRLLHRLLSQLEVGVRQLEVEVRPLEVEVRPLEVEVRPLEVEASQLEAVPEMQFRVVGLSPNFMLF